MQNCKNAFDTASYDASKAFHMLEIATKIFSNGRSQLIIDLEVR